MASYDVLYKRVRELQQSRFEEFEQELRRERALVERQIKVRKRREELRREFMVSIGTDLKKLDAAVEKENRAQEEELKAFLKEGRPKTGDRQSRGAAMSRDAAIHSAVLAETGHTVLPVFASSIVTANKALFNAIQGEWTTGEDDSGWVFPDDPSKVHIKDSWHDSNAFCYDYRPYPVPEFAAHFAFIPATTATYRMLAGLDFHGFYILRCDDSWWNCRDSGVRLTVQMNVHQYSDVGWRDFPALLDVEKDNAEEVTSYDRTHILDYTTGLRAGDPVIVTVQGAVQAYAHGGGAYAELNFADGLFLTVNTA